MFHLILVVKQQNRVLEGHCRHPIFNSRLCVKITINLKWTMTALLSMVAQVFPLNQFIILQFVFCKGHSPRCRLGSWWWLSHIPFLFPVCCGEEDEWIKVLFHPLFWSPYMYCKPHENISCLVSQDSPFCPLPSCELTGVGTRSSSESATTRRCAHPILVSPLKQSKAMTLTPFLLN